jgi:hypothetical protein
MLLLAENDPNGFVDAMTSHMSMPIRRQRSLSSLTRGDVDAPINVLQKFGHFCDRRCRNCHGAIEYGIVEGRGELRRGRTQPTDYSRNVVSRDRFVAGILPLWRERHIKYARTRGASVITLSTVPEDCQAGSPVDRDPQQIICSETHSTFSAS